MPHERFLTHAELSETLHQTAERHPKLVTLQSIGKSYENRDIWVAAVTNEATGAASTKPALWLDGNIHAFELFSSTACLSFFDHLFAQYGKEDTVTRVLDGYAIYLCPRINPDGAELALQPSPKYILSSARPYAPRGTGPGLKPSDIDGDGRILLMRVRDDNGGWKRHPGDRRLMIRRDPGEFGGEYFRLYSEGLIEGHDGFTVPLAPPEQALDLNRNFPANWKPESVQPGAGPSPASEPEVQAMMAFLEKRLNICVVISGHTMSGVLLHPPAANDERSVPEADGQLYRMIGAKGEELTGYPAMSIFSNFRYSRDHGVYGASDWAYEHLGKLWWTIEYWAPHREAGIDVADPLGWFFDHPPAHQLKLMHWNERELQGNAFVDWRHFRHPQLGDVEIGGWDTINYLLNPPPALRAKEAQKLHQWLLWQTLLLPRLFVHALTSTEREPGEWEVRADVENLGYLPTNATMKAIELGVVHGVRAELAAADGVVCRTAASICVGELGGRFGQPMSTIYGSDSTPDRAVVRWLVGGRRGAKVSVRVSHDRAGEAVATTTLGA